ncbi:MAG: hypothetical protein KY455_05255 [Euryarchaeota archaeon]|nr:hypothetical protein [Euryarchaeota archaeon]
MKSLRVLVILLALLAVPLSGCLTQLFDDGPVTQSVLARKVSIVLDENTFDDMDTRFEDVVRTRFEYTHPGGDTSVVGLQVRYTDDTGTDRVRPLSEFTAKSTLTEGDVVTIDRVNITSDLVIEQDGAVLAERLGLRRAWLEIDGTPIPLHTSETGTAVWSLTGTSGFKFDVKDVDLGESGRVEYAKGDFSGTSDGTFSAATTRSGSSTDINYETKIKGLFDAFADSRIHSDGETIETGFDIDAESRLDGTWLMGFRDRALSRTGGGGSVFADGTVHVWDPEHPKSMGWEPEDVEHPFIDEKEPFREESYETDPYMEADQEYLAFMERLWGMTLDVGDDFRFTASYDDAGTGFLFEVVIQVTERVARNVGFGNVDTFRVHETMRFEASGSSYGSGSYDLASFTTWLDTRTYLPVHAQVAYTTTYDEEQIRAFYGAFEDDLPYDLPEDLLLAINSEAVLRLEEYSGDLAVSPLLGITGLSGPLMMMGAGMGMGMMGGPYGDETYYEDEAYVHDDEWEEGPSDCYWDENGDYVCP